MVFVGVPNREIMSSEIAPQLVGASSIEVLGGEVGSVGGHIIVFVGSNHQTFLLRRPSCRLGYGHHPFSRLRDVTTLVAAYLLENSVVYELP